MDKLDYPFTLRPLSNEEGGGYLIEFPDLPGCVADGETIEEAVAEGRSAIKSWLASARKHKDSVPKPGTAKPKVSGKLLQRLPKSLHARLQERAKYEGVSVNTLALSFIAEGLGKRV